MKDESKRMILYYTQTIKHNKGFLFIYFYLASMEEFRHKHPVQYKEVSSFVEFLSKRKFGEYNIANVHKLFLSFLQ